LDEKGKAFPSGSGLVGQEKAREVRMKCYLKEYTVNRKYRLLD